MLKKKQKQATTTKTHLLNGEFVFPHWKTDDKVDSAPQTMKLIALINIQDPVHRCLTSPQRVSKNVSDPLQQHFENGQTATQALTGQSVCLLDNVHLLKEMKTQNMREASLINPSEFELDGGQIVGHCNKNRRKTLSLHKQKKGNKC